MGIFKKMFGSTPQPTEAKTNEPPPGKTMRTLDPQLVVEPFGKVNYWDLDNGGKRVRVYFLLESPIEGAQTGVAIDGSASMQGPFGKLLLGQASRQDIEYYAKRGMVGLSQQDGQQYISWSDQAVKELVARGVFRYTDNIVQQQAREMTAYLSKFDADGGTTVIYWATGDGRQIEVVGDLTGSQCPTASFSGPTAFGGGTHLLPAIKYFVERFADARWGMYVFITDGALNDVDAVKRYTVQLARDIARGKRNDLKFVLIGVGDDINEDQMEELDDLEAERDLWDHKIAREMKQLADIFAEVVSETVIIVPGDGLVKDANGNVVKDYRDKGLPALMWFDLPAGSQWFTLEVGGQVVAQPLAAGVRVPSAEPAPPPPSPAPAVAPATVPCIECREPLPAGTKVCPRCGVSQDRPTPKPAPQPAPAPPPAQPVAPSPAPAPPPVSGAAQLVVDPQALDFGSVTRWKGDLPTQEVRLRNTGGGTWNGTVRSTLPWLEVNPTAVSCPAGGEVVLTVGLTPAGGRLKARVYSVDDAMIVEGEGQTLRVGATMDTRG